MTEQYSNICFYEKPTSPKMHNLTGKRFGQLLILSCLGVKRSQVHWLYLCDCGQIGVVQRANLYGHTQSCGCLKSLPPHNVTHNLTGTSTYIVWRGMKARCYNVKEPAYKNYGGRGIIVCERWKESCGVLLVYIGERPAGLSIDRIDVNGNYEPDNCRWTTPLIQANNMRCNRRITYAEQTRTASEWERELGFKQGTLYNRITANGWSVIDAFEVPIGMKRVAFKNGVFVSRSPLDAK